MREVFGFVADCQRSARPVIPVILYSICCKYKLLGCGEWFAAGLCENGFKREGDARQTQSIDGRFDGRVDASYD